MIIIYALAVVADFGFECFNLFRISDNEYFDPLYFQLYLSLVILFGIAVCLILFYLVAPDSRGSRAVLPWAFLIAGITALLIGAWVITYFYAIYTKSDKFVYVKSIDDDHTGPSNDENDNSKVKPGYGKVRKEMYVLDHSLGSLITGVVLLFFYCTVKGWVDRHENQEKAHG